MEAKPGEEQKHDLLFFFHHSIADGMSVLHLIDQILTCYARMHDKEPLTSEAFGLLPPIESMLEKRHFAPEVSSQSHSSVFGSKDETTPLPFDKSALSQPLLTRHIFTTLSESTLASLKHRSKAEGVTIHSALSATMLMAAHHILAIEDLKIGLVTPVNLRQKTPVPISPRYLSDYVACVTPVLHVSTTSSFLALAEPYQRLLRTEINSLYHRTPKRTTEKEVQHLRHMISEVTKKPLFSNGLVVTNKGYLPLPSSYGPLTVEGHYTSTSHQRDLFMYCSVASMFNRSFLSFAYTDPLVSEETAQRFVKTFMDVLGTWALPH